MTLIRGLKWSVAVACLAAAFMLDACATGGELVSYGASFADAKFSDRQGHAFAVWINPSRDVLLFEKRTGSVVAGALVEGATFGLADIRGSAEVWRAAARDFLADTPCKVTDVTPLRQEFAWEATYECPAGVDLRAAIKTQRAELRKGARLKL